MTKIIYSFILVALSLAIPNKTNAQLCADPGAGPYDGALNTPASCNGTAVSTNLDDGECFTISIAGNSTYTFSTCNTANAGSDTQIDIWANGGGTYIVGNDDSATCASGTLLSTTSYTNFSATPLDVVICATTYDCEANGGETYQVDVSCSSLVIPTCNTCADTPCTGPNFYSSYGETPQGLASGTDCDDNNIDFDHAPILPSDGQVDILDVCFEFTVASSTGFGNSCEDYLSGYSLLSNTTCAFNAANLTIFDASCTAIPPTGSADDPNFGLFDTWDTSTGITAGGTYTMCVDFYDLESSDGIASCIPTAICTAVYVETCKAPTPTNLGVQQTGGTCTTSTGGDSSSLTGGGAGTACNGFNGDADDSQWYSFTACGGSATINVNGGPTYDAVVLLFDDIPCVSCTTPPVLLDCADSSGSGSAETISATGLTAGQTYYIQTYDYSTGAGDTYDICVYGGDATACALLPVTWISFNGQTDDKYNVLYWSTQTEHNNQYQIIERSPNGQNIWTEVGRVDSKNTTSIKSYQVLDTDPLEMSYYRIKALDFDGKLEYSHVISLKREDKAQGNNIKIFPNPTSNHANIVTDYTINENVKISISDLSGRIVKTILVDNPQGKLSTEIDISTLFDGIYLMTLSTSENNTTLKLIKQ